MFTYVKIQSLISFDKFLDSFNISKDYMYSGPNLNSEYGVPLYGNIPRNKLKYIEVERSYTLMQKKAVDMWLQFGDEIPQSYDQNIILK